MGTSFQLFHNAAQAVNFIVGQLLAAHIGGQEQLRRPQLRAALVLLRSRSDSRLKHTALRCAAIEGRDCSLKEEAFQVLAGLKGDPDAEAFFIDYFVYLEGPPRAQSIWEDHLTNIAHSFWA